MSKKEKVENIEPSNVVELSEIIVSDDEFDLTVLRSDIENAEKEAKNAINQEIIDKATFQQETEKTQTFKESIIEALEFLFSFVNRKLEKRDISKFDIKFIDELTEKILKLIPKDQLVNVEKFLGAGDKSKASVQIFRIVKLLMFISQEIYKRFDEYELYREAQGKPQLKIAFKKKDKTEA